MTTGSRDRQPTRAYGETVIHKLSPQRFGAGHGHCVRSDSDQKKAAGENASELSRLRVAIFRCPWAPDYSDHRSFLVLDDVAAGRNGVKKVAEDRPEERRAAVPGEDDLSCRGWHQWPTTWLEVGDAHVDVVV